MYFFVSKQKEGGKTEKEDAFTKNNTEAGRKRE